MHLVAQVIDVRDVHQFRHARIRHEDETRLDRLGLTSQCHERLLTQLEEVFENGRFAIRFAAHYVGHFGGEYEGGSLTSNTEFRLEIAEKVTKIDVKEVPAGTVDSQRQEAKQDAQCSNTRNIATSTTGAKSQHRNCVLVCRSRFNALVGHAIKCKLTFL